ncbi:MAG: thiamine pyrophosphate-binding protein, partial [bacterium]|nr:thiamine pyrophosphate-binding protein [bacterium]
MDTPPPSSPATGTGRSVAASTETATAAGPDAAETTVSSAVAEVLAAHTAHVFGIMGEGNAHFLDRAEAAGLPVTPTRHEAGAVSAADAYYRASSRLAVATT